MRWRRRRFQRLRRATPVLPHDYEVRYLKAMFKAAYNPEELRKMADEFIGAGYIQHAVRLKEIAHILEKNKDG